MLPAYSPPAYRSFAMRTPDLPIGVFDSGVGGLTVLRALVDRLPDERMTYLGDTARVPYGNRAAETVRRYARNATHLLVDRGIKALVVACNTASAYALPTLVDSYDLPVVGVIDPVARRAAETTQNRSIGILGTRGTVRSNCYPDALERHAPDCTIHQVASPLLVPLAEEGWTRGDVTYQIAEHYIGQLEGTGVDTIILGCTHYPILEPVLRQAAADVLEGEVAFLDSASATADVLAERLVDADLRRDPEEDAPTDPLDFLFTDISPAFAETTEQFFGARPETLHHVDISDVT